MGVTVSSSHLVSAAPSSSGEDSSPSAPAPVWVHHRATSPASEPSPAWAPLSVGPQVRAGACSIVGSPQGHSLLQASSCSGVGSSPGCRRGSALPWTSMDCRAQPDPPWSSPQAAGNLCSSAWSTSCPPSALTLGSAGLLLSHILTPLSLLLFHSRFTLLSSVTPEVLPPSLTGLALASSGFVFGTGSVGHGRL